MRPSLWAAVPIRALYRRRVESNRSDLPLLSVYRDYGVVERDGRDDNFNKASEDLSTYLVVHPRDLVLNKMKTWQGSLGVSTLDGIVSPAYFVGEQVGEIEPRFAHHLLRSQPLIAEYAARSKGIRPAQWDLAWDEFRRIKIKIPPVAHQRAIADFLDAETDRLNTVIAAKRRSHALLWERYVAEIDSSCGAIGKFVPLKRVAKVAYGLGQPPPLSEDGVALIRATNISKGSISDVDMIRASVDDIPLARAPLLTTGEILVVRSGAYTGDSALITKKWEGSAPGYDLRVTPFRIEPRFLAHQLLGRLVESQVDLVRSRAAQPHLNAEDLGQVQVVSADESIEISVADRLDRSRSVVNALVVALDRQVLLLDERRQALITAAVTGQLHIRGAA